MNIDVEQVIRDYLPEVLHMSLGTARGDVPWVCEVHFAYDDDLNLYFHSQPNSRHGQEIAANPKVAGNIVAQHPTGLAPKGVYFEGMAEQLEGNEHATAFAYINERSKLGGKLLEDVKNGDARKIYKITVSTYYLFDARDTRPPQKIELKWQ